MKEIFIIVLVIIGALIGAGFASGQEIYSFFYCYGLKGILGLILNILLLVTFYIMIAGFGAYFEQEIGISRILGSLILAILCFCVFLTSVKGVLKVSQYLVPILIIFILLIGINNILSININKIERVSI